MDPQTAVAVSTRTRKRHERRDRVYDAAIALFVERGFDETSMDDIAARAELARTTVFNHFPRKALFLEEWARRRRERAAVALDAELDAVGLREVLERYVAGLAVVNVESRTETTALMSLSLKVHDVFRGHTLGQDLTDLIVASGQPLRPGADAAQVGRLIALGYYSAVVRWIQVEPAPFDLGRELSAVLDTVLSGALDD